MQEKKSTQKTESLTERNAVSFLLIISVGYNVHIFVLHICTTLPCVSEFKVRASFCEYTGRLTPVT